MSFWVGCFATPILSKATSHLALRHDHAQLRRAAKGREAVREYDGSLDDFPGDYSGPMVEGSKRAVLWIGDPPFGTAQIRFVAGRCPYIVFVNPDGDMSGKGLTDRQLRQYAKDL